jgi:ethanolamine utilization protein EutN
MKLGKIIGKVWATSKDPKLNGLKLYILQPVNEELENISGPQIAVDTVGSREDDLVYWVGGAEATFPLPDRQIPSDCSIIGLVDRIDQG